MKMQWAWQHWVAMLVVIAVAYWAGRRYPNLYRGSLA